MKKKLLFVFIFFIATSAHLLAQATVNITIVYNGAQAQGCGNICSADYWCVNNTGGCGTTAACDIRNFMDPVPPGNIITGITVVYFAAGCSSSVPTYLNNVLVGSASGDSNCVSGSCTQYPIPAKIYICPIGLPGYNYGGLNQFQVCPTSGFCPQRVVITFTYKPLSILPTDITATPGFSCGGSVTLTKVGGSLAPGASWKWYAGGCGTGTVIGTGASITVNPATTTTYFLRAEGSDCNTFCDSIQVIVNTPSTAPTSATANLTSICSDTTITLTVHGGSLAGGASWKWYAGGCGTGAAIGTGTSITVNPTTTTTYFVRAEGNGCNTTCASIQVTVNSPSTDPVSATATLTNTCGDTTTLTVNGGNLGSGAGWKWYSGGCGSNNGGSLAGTGTTISVAPTDTTTYYVQAEGTCNTTNCAQITVTVNPIPFATVTSNPQTLCSGGTTNINLSSSLPNTQFNWTVTQYGVTGAGNDSGYTTINQTLTTSDTTPGTATYTITPTANGCSGNPITTTVVIVNTPTAWAGNDFSKCKYQSVPVTGTGGFSYKWYNEDYSTLLSSANPYNAQDTADTHYNLIVTDSIGCVDTAGVSVSITLPHAQFTADSVCYHQANSFTDSSTVANQMLSSWLWNYGDGTIVDTTHNPMHIFPNAGIFNTTLIITTANGCNDTITRPVLVYALPTANFHTISPPGICDGSIVFFNDTSSIITPYSLNEWNWNFGDNTPIVYSENANHLYSNPGTYSIKLIVTSNEGCTDSIAHTVTINPNPVANFTTITPRFGCTPLCVTFQDSSSVIPPGQNVQWTWTYPAGTSSSQNFYHCFENDSVFSPAYYDISLTVTTDSGCTATTTKPGYVIVYPNPQAHFVVDPTTAGIAGDLIFTITDMSTGTNFWHWDYGDNSIDSTATPPPHQYNPDTATYTITLITSTLYNCYDTATQTVLISPDFTFYIPNAFSPNEDNINDYFFAKGTGIIEYDLWIFDRWGNMIYHGQEIPVENTKWDGKANNGKKIAQKDVYVWKVQLKDVFNKTHNYIGTVTLVN